MSVSTLLQMDGSNLDIVYPDETQVIHPAAYGNIIYWNDPRLIPELPAITAPMPIHVSAGPTKQPTASSNPQYILSFSHVSTVDLYVIAASISVAVAVITAILKFKKKR
jgi:hypothetical protein